MADEHAEFVAQVEPAVTEAVQNTLTGDPAVAGAIGTLQEQLSDPKLAEGDAKGAGEAGPTPVFRIAAETAARTAKNIVLGVGQVINANVLTPIEQEIAKLQAQYPQVSFDNLKNQVSKGAAMLGASPTPASSVPSAAPVASSSGESPPAAQSTP